MQEKYNFKAHTFHAAGFDNRDDFRAAHGSDLYLTDIEAYDRICKASTLGTDMLPAISGQRQAVSNYINT